jgi:hypothetical protein
VQALAAEKAAAAHEREMEVARLRALQEKVQDTRSAEDELRAKRYQVSAANKLKFKEQQQNRCTAPAAASIFDATATLSPRHLSSTSRQL